ncbi:MAG: sulfatase [Candidatus Latescibacteria bacterium]|nr:sulfatase [Candidatus Latescibacterota bacterium]
MNLIIIVLDSFRQDHVSLYNQGHGPFDGVKACVTPRIDRFAEDGIVFENAYPEALPTIPIRCQLMTGQRTLPYRPWSPLHPQDITLAEILRREGYVCGLISDTYHYRAPGMNYHKGFHAYRWVRGQEYDPYVSSPTRRNLDDYVNAHYPAHWRTLVGQFLANTDAFTEEADWFPAKVVVEAVDWLKQNRGHKHLCLWVDSFDPHEPWDPPQRFDTYTDPRYTGPRLIIPMGGRASAWASEDEQRQIQGLYAGEAAFVDSCLEPLFTCLEEEGYTEDSLIILLADHGHPLGDHGKFLKGADRLYNELLKVPFIVRLPGGQSGGRRTQAIIQFHDILPTILDLLELGHNASSMHGRSFAPVLRGDRDTHHEVIITGYHEGIDRCIRDATWSYIQRPEGEPDELYHLIDDPRETRNLIDDHREEARRLSAQFGSYFRRAQSRVIKGIQGKDELASGGVE